MISRTAPLCIALLLALAPLLTLQGCAAHRAARQQLKQGRLDDLLRSVRPVDAEAHVLRAQALRRKGQLHAAHTELLLGRARDERAADVHLLLGFVELELRQEGAALGSLRRALELRPDQRCLRRTMALLLLRRAAYREVAGPGPLSEDAVKRDRDEALALDPCLGRAALARLTPSPAVCPGVSAGLDHGRPLPRPRGRGCGVTRPAAQVQRLQRRELLLGCRGPRLALRLEAAGCVGAALSVWQRLSSEAPGDPRWFIEVARAELALGRSARAEQLIQQYVYEARDRAAALLDVAAVWLHAGRPKKAGRAAVEAIAFAKVLDQHLAAIKVLRAAGQGDQARQLCKITLAARWPNVSRQRLIDLVEQTLRSTP